MVTSSGIGTLASKEQPGNKKKPGDTSTALVSVHELLHAGNTTSVSESWLPDINFI